MSGVAQSAGCSCPVTLLRLESPSSHPPGILGNSVRKLRETPQPLTSSWTSTISNLYLQSSRRERDGVNSWWPTSGELPVIGLSELDLVIWGQHTAPGGHVKIFVSAGLLQLRWWPIIGGNIEMTVSGKIPNVLTVLAGTGRTAGEIFSLCWTVGRWERGDQEHRWMISLTVSPNPNKEN